MHMSHSTTRSRPWWPPPEVVGPRLEGTAGHRGQRRPGGRVATRGRVVDPLERSCCASTGTRGSPCGGQQRWRLGGFGSTGHLAEGKFPAEGHAMVRTPSRSAGARRTQRHRTEHPPLVSVGRLCLRGLILFRIILIFLDPRLTKRHVMSPSFAWWLLRIC